MSYSKQWLALLHINENNQSEIHDLNFYLSKQKNPQIEMQTLLKEQSCENICKHPAKYKFLSENLDLNISFEHCEDLQNFLKQSRGNSSSIVFASSFLGSPTSYFGHTFIKINKPKNIYFSQTLSYAAEMPQATGIKDLIIKGIGGGFTGKYVASPYFKLIEGYSIVEQRTLYEYQLDLTPNEIEMMLWHSYEMLNTNIPYKFFTENCAYEIFWLLDVARPSANLRQKLKPYVIPYETINVLRQSRMIKNTIVREPLIDRLYQIYQPLTPEGKTLFAHWKNSENKDEDLKHMNLAPQTKNLFIELANGYYDILFKKFRTSKADFNEVKKMSFKKTDLNITTDFLPKKSHKLSVGVIDTTEGNGEILQFRPVLFDRFEERDNYLSEATLEFLNIGISRVNDVVKLENFDIVKMESFNKRFDFYEPISWRVYAGLNRTLEEKNLEPVFEFGSGVTKGTDFMSAYILAQLALYPTNTTVGIQSLAGVSVWLDRFHINFDFKKTYYESNEKVLDEKVMTLFYPLNQSLSIRTSRDFENTRSNINLEVKF